MAGRFAAGAALAALALLPLGCKGRSQRPVSLVGSTSVQPFAELLAEEYHRRHGEREVDVQGGGSTAGIQALSSGIADIGTCSRDLKKQEAAALRPIEIARDGLAVIVHLGNPIDGLTRERVRRLFSGQVANWKELGGSDVPVRAIVREEGSGTREAFVHGVMGKVRIWRRALVQESNGSVKELVRGDPGAVGYMSLGLVGHEVKALRIDGVAPTSAEVTAGRYPLSRPFLFVVKGTPPPAAQAFIDFALSPDGQKLLAGEGLVRVR